MLRVVPTGHAQCQGPMPVQLSRPERGPLPSRLLRQIQHCSKPVFSSHFGLFSLPLLWCEREGATCACWLLVNVSLLLGQGQGGVPGPFLL